MDSDRRRVSEKLHGIKKEEGMKQATIFGIVILAVLVVLGIALDCYAGESRLGNGGIFAAGNMIQVSGPRSFSPVATAVQGTASTSSMSGSSSLTGLQNVVTSYQASQASHPQDSAQETIGQPQLPASQSITASQITSRTTLPTVSSTSTRTSNGITGTTVTPRTQSSIRSTIGNVTR